MSKKHVWLHTSLFCNKSNWNTLLSEGIRPFVINLTNKQEILFYQLEFNYTSGENIRLLLQAPAGSAAKLAKETDRYFKEFFSSAGYPPESVELPVDGFFIPFPANTIQYGLYQLEYEPNLQSEQFYGFQMALSFVMIQALADEAVDDETILTFAFYLHTTWLKNLQQYTGLDIKQLLVFYNSGFITDNEERIQDDFKEQKFNENRDTLTEIADSILYNNSTDAPAWLAQWDEICNSQITTVMQSATDNNYRVAHNLTIPLLNKQLGLTENMKIVLGHFIKETLLLLPV